MLCHGRSFPRFCYLNFMRFTFFGFPCCSTREDLSIDECSTDIDEAKVISALRHKSKFNLELFWRKIQIFRFPCCSRFTPIKGKRLVTCFRRYMFEIARTGNVWYAPPCLSQTVLCVVEWKCVAIVVRFFFRYYLTILLLLFIIRDVNCR